MLFDQAQHEHAKTCSRRKKMEFRGSWLSTCSPLTHKGIDKAQLALLIPVKLERRHRYTPYMGSTICL